MILDVALLRQAEADIDFIIDWIASRSPSGARNWHRALESALDWLVVNPQSCPLAPENEFFAEEILEHLFKTRRGRYYRLLFTLAGNQVRILHVRGPGQDWVRPE